MTSRQYIYSVWVGLALTACAENDLSKFYDGLTEEEYNMTKYFDFKTSDEVQLTVDYGEENAYATVVLFDQMPTFTDEGTPAEGYSYYFAGMLNAEGRLDSGLKLPGGSEGFVLYCDGKAAPMAQVGQMVNDSIVFTNPYADDAVGTRAQRSATRATTASYELYPIDAANKYYCLTDWEPSATGVNRFGQGSDNNRVMKVGKYSRKLLSLADAFKGKAASYLDDGTFSYKGTTYTGGTDIVNMHLTQATEVDLTFIYENSALLDVIGYYYYPTGSCPSSGSGVKKIILNPVLAQGGNVPFDGNASDAYKRGVTQSSPTSQNTTFQLLYEDASGNVSTTFPAGYTIGFFCITDGFDPGWHPEPDEMDWQAFLESEWAQAQTSADGKKYYKVQDNTASSIATNGGTKKVFNTTGYKPPYIEKKAENISLEPRYSNKEWNYDAFTSKRGVPSWACVNSGDGKLIYAVEDSYDDTFCDMVFYVQTSVDGAFKTDGIPMAQNIGNASYKDDEKPSDWANGAYDYTKSGNSTLSIRYNAVRPVTWAFEDCWPERGDYDLNDVIVEHRQNYNYDANGMVYHVYDYYEVVQPAGSASQRNAFGIKLPAADRAKVQVIKRGPLDNYVETNKNEFIEDNGSMILFADCNNARGIIVGMTRYYGGTLKREDLLKEDVDPFIVCKYEGLNVNRRAEVHLPKHKPTPLGTSYTTGAGSYYLDMDGIHPFALEIPEKYSSPTEKSSIDLYYPQFTLWAESRGTKYANWYLHHQ